MSRSGSSPPSGWHSRSALGESGTLKFNPAMAVHAEQGIELHRPLDPDGSVVITGKLVDIADKRSGALLQTEASAVDAETHEPVFTTTSGLFIRGEGGFASSSGGGDAQPPGIASPEPPPIPERSPDHQATYQTFTHQALLYRLCGDRNPLHSDPSFAGRAGFDRPILHGLCTYGFTGRAVLHALCDSDPTRLRSMYGRFSKPVMPGQSLTISIWVDDDGHAAGFKTTTDDGAVVLDRGRCTFS
jgi:acyl dehydratase